MGEGLNATLPPLTPYVLLSLGHYRFRWGRYLTACANDFCREAKRQTISAQDVMQAIKELEFGELEEPLKEYLDQVSTRKYPVFRAGCLLACARSICWLNAILGLWVNGEIFIIGCLYHVHDIPGYTQICRIMRESPTPRFVAAMFSIHQYRREANAKKQSKALGAMAGATPKKEGTGDVDEPDAEAEAEGEADDVEGGEREASDALQTATSSAAVAAPVQPSPQVTAASMAGVGPVAMDEDGGNGAVAGGVTPLVQAVVGTGQSSMVG